VQGVKSCGYLPEDKVRLIALRKTERNFLFLKGYENYLKGKEK
jgi:hypothetical protein